MLKNYESLGFTFSRTLQEVLLTKTKEELAAINDVILPALKERVGDSVKYRPMYPNFPQQVMDASDAELYINALLHYFGDWVGVRIMPQYEKEDRPPLLESTELRVITVADDAKIHELLGGLMSSRTSISEADRQEVARYIKHFGSHATIPDEFNHKEIMAFVVKTILDNNIDIDINRYFKTATDVLRLAVAMSDGDVSLKDNTKFINFKRKTRRLLLSLLESCGEIAEDMYIYRMRWIRLGERLHPGDYKEKYPKTIKAFDKIRDDLPIERYNSLVEKYIEEKDIDKLLPLLAQRPGYFARRLDHILRIAPESKNRAFMVTRTILRFRDVACKVSTPVLLQLKAHFSDRDNLDYRVFFPKGSVAKMHVKKDKLKRIKKSICKEVVAVCDYALMRQYASRENLGKVYIQEELKDYIVPFSQRSASKALKTLVRGSKIDIPIGKDTIRYFIHWKDIENYIRVDIDLSSIMFDADWNYKRHISYTNLRSGEGCHSGDITSAPDGACEFIDLSMESMIDSGIRYVIMSVFSYSRQPFNTVPELFAGWMLRERPKSGEIFDPRTVVNKVDLTSETKACIPLIIDLKERKVIWADLSVTSMPAYNNNLESNLSTMATLAKSIVSLRKMDLYSLFELHARVRGQQIDDIKEADTVFSLTEGITPFDIEKIISEFI
jgi:stress response protein SCP2